MAEYTNGIVTTMSKSSSSVSTQQSTVLREVTVEAKSTGSRTFGSSMEESYRAMTSIDSFLDYIASERLRRMPHPGSKWDRVLAYAAFFASQTHLFVTAIEEYVPQSQDAARVIWANMHRLLEMGPEHANTLERLFVVYYSLGQTFQALIQYRDYSVTSTEVQQSLGHIFSDVIRLVIGTVSQFGQTRSTPASVLSSEIYRNYGILIANIHSRKDSIFNLIWESSVRSGTGVDAHSIRIETLRNFLSPSDRTVRSLTSSSVGSLGSKGSRTELTCEWMRPHLLDFVRGNEQVMVVQGKAGTGKTFLSGWIAEALQRVEGKKVHHDTISFSVERDVCTQTSITAVAKGLLLQLFDRNIGNTAFYRILCDAFEAGTQGKPVDEVESSLWRAIDAGLARLSNTMIIVDGLDQIDGDESTGLRLLDNLNQLCSKHSNAKAIALSQPLTKAAPQGIRSFVIEPSYTIHDIQHQVREVLTLTPQFRNLNDSEKERMVTRIVTVADGSFIMAVYCLELLKRQNTGTGILQALEKLPKTIQEALTQLQSLVNLQETDTRSLLAWLLAAQRPLTLDEVKVFLEIDLTSCSHKPRISEVEQDVVNAVGPVVTISNGCVRFKHDTIRTYFITLAASVKDYSNTGSFPFMMKEAHFDLTNRCLAYTKIFVTRRVDPIFGQLSSQALSDVYEQHPAIEYSATYWLAHFKLSPMYVENGKHKLVPEFKTCFPESTLLAQVEGTVWPAVLAPDYELALTIRESILGQQSMVVLQNIITLAFALELVSYHKAASYYYRAYPLAQNLLGEESDVLTRISIAYLKCSSSTTVTEKNEVYVQREKMLQRIIGVYKETYGASHSVTVLYTRMLAQLYTDTKQFDLATTIWQEVYQVYVQIYGEFHAETSAIYQSLEKTLKNSSRKDDIKSLTYARFETNRFDTQHADLSITETRPTTSDEEMLDYYEGKNDHAKLESALIDQWRLASESASTSRDIQTHKRKLDIIKRYIDFLKRRNRQEEARIILDGVATEYQNHEISSELIAASFQSLAEEMRSLNMLKTARSVFSSLASYFEAHKITSTQASTVAQSLQETTQLLIESTTTTTTSSSSSATETTTTADESTLTEVFESLVSMSSNTSSTRFASIIKTGQKLSLFYYRQQRFSECFRACSQALTIMWPYFITRQGQAKLPSEYQKEVIELVLRMGTCTWSLSQIEKTQDIYVTAFKATKNTVKTDDDLYSLTSQALTEFYQETYQIKNFLMVMGEIYNDQKSQLGASDPVTIKTAYRIARYCMQQSKYKEAEPYLVEIWTVLVTSANFSVDAVPAAEFLLTIYDQDARWESAEKLCSTIWDTLQKRGSEARFSVDLIEKVYNTYLYVLQDYRKVSHEELYKFTKAYKECCQKVFGERNELTLKVTLQFAQICETNDSHRKEALTVYEEAFKHIANYQSISTTSTMMQQTISVARSNLSRLYIKESATSNTASQFVHEQFESSRSTHGMNDERSVEKLAQLVAFNHKQNKTEFTQQSVRLLQAAVIETIKKEKSNQTLIESASKLAQSYVSINQTELAWDLLREIRRQVISGDHASSKFNFSLEGTDRRGYVFIIAFTQALKGMSASANFSEQMADLMTETLLYQAYQKSIAEKSRFNVVFEHGARLAIFYRNTQRKEDCNRVWNQLLEQFAVTMQVAKTSTTLHEFFDMVTAEFQHGDTTIIQLSADRIKSKMQASKFQEAADFATYTYKFADHFSDWRSQQKVESGLSIALLIVGRGDTAKPTDQKVYASMLEISKAILTAVLHAARKLNIRFMEMSMSQINNIVALLSEQQNYRDLEWLLSELWNSRHGQTSMDSVTIVWIGRRLVEVRFATGHREAAINLCEDILYNVRRVWGPSDKVTVQMVDLLAELYSAIGDHNRAIGTHEEMLRQVILSVEEEEEISQEQGAQIAAQELELMKRSYQRNQGWGNRDATVVKNLYTQLVSSFGNDKAVSNVQNLEKWSIKEKPDTRGVWQKPASFEFAGDSQQTHKNHLKWTSGLYDGIGTRHRRVGSVHVNGA